MAYTIFLSDSSDLEGRCTKWRSPGTVWRIATLEDRLEVGDHHYDQFHISLSTIETL